MSRYSCCTILVWVLLQLLCFSSIVNNSVKLIKQINYYKELRMEIKICFTQNLQSGLSQKSVADLSGWKSSDFDRQYVTISQALSFPLVRNIILKSTMEFEVQAKRPFLMLSNEGFRNVSNEEKSIEKSKRAFSLQRIRKHIIALINTLTIYSLKLTHISKYSNLLAEQVAKEGMTIISILRNRNSRNSAKMQLFCIIDNNYDSLAVELRHAHIISHHNSVNYFLWILNCDFTTDSLKDSVSNFEGPWNVNVKTFGHNGIEASFFRISMILDSHNSNSQNYNISSSNIDQNRNNPKAPNESSFIKEKNSRKSRFLLSLNSESNLDEANRDINTSQKARHARNKRVPSTNNQRDSQNGNLYATKVERRRKRKSRRRRLAKDLTFAAEAKRAKSSSSSQEEVEEEADATKLDARISFSTDNEADYHRREIDRQIEADFAKIKDTLRLEKANGISSAEIARWPSSNAVKNNRQSVSWQPTIDTQEPEMITGKRVGIAAHCQQAIRHGLRAKSPNSNELPANSRGDGNIASEQNGIAVASRKVVDEKIQHGNGNDNDNDNDHDGRKLVGEALIILNKGALPLTIVQKSNDSDVNLKYSVESISLGLDELVKMGEEVMKKELDKVEQNETKRAAAGLSRKNCLKYAKGNNETYRGLEDDEGTKLEEQLKELRSMHIQREKQGFTNSAAGKNEMRFAAGDEYTFRNDEAARLNNEYSRERVRYAKKRCRRKKHKSSTALNTSQKRKNNLIKTSIPYRKQIKKSLQNLSNDVAFGDTLVGGVTKTSARIKKNNPYREYEESGVEEKLLPDKKVVEYSRKKTSRETHSPSKNKEVSEEKIENPQDSHVKFGKSSTRLIPRKVRAHKIIKKNMRNRQSSAMSPSVIKPQSRIRKKNKLPQSLSSRKLKSVQVGGIIRQPFSASKSDTLSRDIGNYYDYEDLAIPTNSFDQVLENRNAITNAPRRKLLSSNSLEYEEGSSISANEESNYDYVEKFYGDRPYEKGALRLHYSQINLRNVTPLVSVADRIEGEASKIELAQCHASKSVKTISANHKSVSKIRYPKRTLQSVEQEEQSDYLENKHSVKNLYLSGDLIGYNYDPEENDEKEPFKREIDENQDPDLARLFANGQEYDINVRGKLHLRLKDPESNVASEKSSKKKRSARPKIRKSREKLAQAERKFAVVDKRTKRNPDEDSTDVHKEDGNLKSKVSNKMRKPLKKISDFFKRKFAGVGSSKKKFRKKIHAKAKIVRVKPGRQDEDNNSQSTFSPLCDQSTTTLESRRGNCKCTLESTTTTTTASEFTTDTSEAIDYNTQSTESHESITENNHSNYEVYSKICHCRERSTEMSSIITTATPQYVTNRPETDYSSTKAQLSHEIVSGESPETTSVISTNREISESSPEQNAKMKNVVEILNFIKNLEKLLKGQKIPFRIEDENGGVEIKLEKIYIRPGKNQSIVELKDVSDADQKKDISGVGDTSDVIRQSNVERPILSSSIENVQSLSNTNSKFSSNANIKNDQKENIFDEKSQNIEKPKNNAILETYIEASLPKSSQLDKNVSDNESLPAKQWIDEQRIASDDQSSSRGRGSTSSDRKRKKRRRKKRRRRPRKRNVNGTGIAPKKGKAPYRLRRRRRRRLFTT